MGRLLSRMGQWIVCSTDGKAPNDWKSSPRFKSCGIGMSAGIKWVEISFANDATDIDICCNYNDDTQVERLAMFAAADFRKLAAWYLWRFAWGEWFGLRRRAFYWRLRRVVTRRLDPLRRG